MGVALGLPISAMAQGIALDEVVVTAQKTEETLQSTPIAVTAFTAKDLEKIGAMSVDAVAGRTPNLFMAEGSASSAALVAGIRGVSHADPTLSRDSKVGIYLDGVYLARNAGAIFDVAGIEQVEVLRGPQGTLWGKNTTAGAINMITAKPQGALGFRQAFSVGNSGFYRSTTTLDTPEVAGLSAKLTYMRSERDGMVKNTSPTGEDTFGSDDTEAGRLALRWQALDWLTVDYSYDDVAMEAGTQAFQLSFVDPNLAASPTAFQAGLPGGLVAITNPFYQAAQEVSSDRRGHLASNINSPEQLDISGHTLTMAAELGDLELKSITAYRDYASDARGLDLDGGDYSMPIFQGANKQSQDQFSQEFQFIGSALDDRLSYVAGVYYFEEEGKSNNPQTLTVRTGTTPSGAPIFFNATSRLNYSLENKSWALYGQATYTPSAFDERLHITPGLRYTRDRKEVNQRTLGVTGSETWSNVNPALTIAYDITEDVNAYVKAVTGYNSGIYNVRATTAAQFLTPADEENVISYELGVKAELLDRRLRINTAYFYLDYDDLQVTQFQAGPSGAASVITNAGSASIQGIELELLLIPVEGLTVGANYGYTDFKYKEFITSRNLITGVEIDRAGDALPMTAPENQASVFADYEIAQTAFGNVSLMVDASYMDKYYFAVFKEDGRNNAAESRTLVNARLTWDEIPAGNGELRFAVWGKNLSNKEYRVYGLDFGQLGFSGNTYGDLRTYGIDVEYHY